MCSNHINSEKRHQKISHTLKRACIYFIYDKSGVVDEYIIDQIKDLSRNVEFLHCVVNGHINDEGKAKLEQYVDEVYLRENKGLDAGAYKDTIHHLGWERLEAFDEIILMNFTCFGPIYPLSEVFTWADQQQADFWGLTADNKFNALGCDSYLHFNKSKICYQSNFLAMRKPLLGSDLLKSFFEEIPNELSYIESGHFFEYAFPGYFEERGYKGALYCQCDDLDYPLLHDPVRLLKEFRVPLIKKRSFFHFYSDVVQHGAGEATLRLLDYLKKHTDYNIDRIWESVLRTCELSDVMRCAQLNRVLPKHVQVGSQHHLKVGLVFHAYYEDLFDDNIAYVANMPDDASILLTTNTEKKKAALEQKLASANIKGSVIVIENRGRDISSLLVGAAEFVFEHDLICFAHDKKSSQINRPGIGRAWAYKLHENVLGSKEYVRNVISLFEDEKRLGIAFPSYPNHGQFAEGDTFWTGNFYNVKQFLQEFGVDVKIDERTMCIAPMGTCFWFRPSAMQNLFAGFSGEGWTYNDFPCEPNRNDNTILHCIERVFAYFAQSRGYYPVFIYNDEYVKIELTNLEFMKYGSSNMRYWNRKIVEDSLHGNKQKKILKGKSISKIFLGYYRYKIMSKIAKNKNNGKYGKKYLEYKQELAYITQNPNNRRVTGKSVFSALCNYYKYKLLSRIYYGRKKQYYKEKYMNIKCIFNHIRN